MAGLAMMNLFLLVVLVCLVPMAYSMGDNTVSPFMRQGPAVSYIHFDIINEDYESFFRRFREIIQFNSTREVCRHPVLPPQTPNTHVPPMWIVLGLSCGVGHNPAILLRNDNLFQVAVMNTQGTWYNLDDTILAIPGIPAAINTGTDYHQLIDGGNTMLHTVPLGKDNLIQACRNYSKLDFSSNMDHLKLSVLQSFITYSESQRFFSIHDVVRDTWSTGGFLEEKQGYLVISWKDISRSLLIWNSNGEWKVGNFNAKLKEYYVVSTAEDALKLVDVLVIPYPFPI